MGIQYLTYQEIDKAKWDDCIVAAPNGLIYAHSCYLDAMAQHWDAMVLNDYDAVMPLTWNKKYAFHYLYQPAFTASLGVFGKNISAGLVNDFLAAIPKKFSYWDIYLNHGNYVELADFPLYERMNYVLPLKESYENIQQGFRDNIKRNVKKSEQLNNIAKKDIPIADVIVLSKEQTRDFSSIDANTFERFEKLYHLLHSRQQAITYGIYSPTGQLIASAAFFYDRSRAYYILVGNHPNGKTLGASHALLNEFIRDHAGQDLLLDFEGSDIHNLAFFYSSFGGVEEKYAGIRLNRLPFYARWLKK